MLRSPLAGRHRPTPNRSGPRRRSVPQRQTPRTPHRYHTHRTRWRINRNGGRLKHPDPQVLTISPRAGTAKAYIYDNKPVQKYAEIAAAEQEAKTADRGLWGPPCNGDTESTPFSAPKSAPGIPVPGASVYYPNCKAARAAGVAPLHVGQPGYRSGLDGDGDGVACEG